jgi:hypothetical protein
MTHLMAFGDCIFELYNKARISGFDPQAILSGRAASGLIWIKAR